MKVAIAYAGKTGTTEKCAKLLAKSMPNASLIDLNKVNLNFKKFDLIILGSSIRMGVIHPKVRELITNNMEEIKKKKIAMYICSGMQDKDNNYYINNISKDLLKQFIAHENFGGEVDMSKQKGLDKFIIKMIVRKNKDILDIKINEKKIKDFAIQMNTVTK